MIGILVFFLIFFFLCLCYIMAMRLACGPNSRDDEWDDMDETTTTTTTTITSGHDHILQGNLSRYYVPHLGYCVRDPVDHEEVIVQASDDRYEDADGKIWAIV